MNKKRLLSMGLAVMMAASVLTGCGRKEDDKESGSGSAKGNKITIWTNMETETKTLQEYADKWGEKTGNTVKVVHQGADVQQLAQAVKSADGPDGIYGAPNDQLASFVAAGLVQEVPEDKYKNEDYEKAASQASYYEGKRYGLPVSVETMALYYNKDKIKEIPKSWEEMLEMAKDKGGIQFESTSVYYDLGFLRANDSYIFKYEDGSYDVDDIGMGNEGAVKSYEFIEKMVKDYKFFDANITSDIAKSNFQNGDSAFYIGGPWDLAGFKEAGVNFGITTLPSYNGKDFVTPVGTQMAFVSSKTKNSDLVWDLYQYLIDEASGKLFEVGGRIPANLKAQEGIEQDDVTKTFIEQIGKGEPMPTVAELGQVWVPYQDNMKLLLSGELSAKEAAKYIEEQVKEGIEVSKTGK